MARALPQRRAEPSLHRLPEQPRRPTSKPAVRVLVGEDNLVNQKLVVHLLRRMGYSADVVADGRQAVEACRLFPYKLILMDSHMLEMDGFQAAQLIRELETPQRKTVIISITANALEGDRERSLAAGMDDYIAKPVNAALFEEKLTRWVDALATKESDSTVPAYSNGASSSPVSADRFSNFV